MIQVQTTSTLSCGSGLPYPQGNNSGDADSIIRAIAGMGATAVLAHPLKASGAAPWRMSASEIVALVTCERMGHWD